MTEHYHGIAERRRLVRKWQLERRFKRKYHVIITCYFLLLLAGVAAFEAWRGLLRIVDRMLLPSQ